MLKEAITLTVSFTNLKRNSNNYHICQKKKKVTTIIFPKINMMHNSNYIQKEKLN